jgi:hypothetical protein
MFPKNQGDQIGRTFAYWVLVLHWEVFWKSQRQPKFISYFFPREKLWNNFDKNEFGLILGEFFHKLIWSHCQKFVGREYFQDGGVQS